MTTGNGTRRRAAWIGLGANLPSRVGGPKETLAAARARIGELPETRVTAVSSLYESAPVDAGGPPFINQVLRVDTALPALSLLEGLQAIELAFGRERPFRNAPRTLDLDLLLVADETRTDAVLTLPHPRLHERLFVLMPLAEIDADLHVPGLGTTATLLAQLMATKHGQDCRRLA